MKTTDFCIGRWLEIFEYYGLPHHKSLKHVICPLCGKKNFRIDDKNGSGSWICNCSSGYGFQLLMEATGKEFKELASEIDKEFGNTQDPMQPVKQRLPSKKEQTTVRYHNLQQVDGSPVQTYLNNRGINTMPGFSIRYSKAEYDNDTKNSYQTMYAIATDDHNKIIYAHKTYLENGKKADVERNKKIFTMNDNKIVCGSCGHESAQSCAIRLCNYGEELGIAEGIETSLSATILYQVPCWSTINTSIMKAFKAPKRVKHLIIFADNDPHGAGMAAAMVCGNKNINANNDVEKVSIRWHETHGVDFNDMLNNGEREYQEFILTK